MPGGRTLLRLTVLLAALAVAVVVAPASAGAAIGDLSFQGCIQDGTGPCSLGNGLTGVHGVAVSPDGGNVYTAAKAPGPGSVCVFSRDATTGAIGETACFAQGGAGGCTSDPSWAGCGRPTAR